ncbi:MAG: DUF1638 domain-containing protein [Clostridiales Family XIII bacterium]|jgi:hypothetical protein|nr:DUF1638 domain-containing protein [Clostridiales Family XIII bacterium]
MRTKLIACNMIRDEVALALANTGVVLETTWVEEGLHNSVEKLGARIQSELDASDDFDRVLLAFGMCGNFLKGLRVGDFELIVPAADDCVTLMLHPHRRGKETGVYYLTAGWTRYKGNAWDEEERYIERFGEKKAKRLMSAMFGGYRAVSVIDTGAFDTAPVEAVGARAARKFGWERMSDRGSVEWLESLLTGPYDEKFLIFPPKESIKEEQLIWTT